MNDQIYNVPIEARERGERLRRLRNLANLPRKVLCEEANININTYIGYEVGRYGGLTKKGAIKLLDYFNSKGVYCAVDWLIEGHGKTPYVITDLELNSQKTSDDFSISVMISEEQKIKEEILLFHEHYKNSVDLQISDDGMSPVYESGSYVAGIPYYEPDIHILIGSNCIVQTKNGENFVRNIREGRTENTYTLTCINPETVINEPILYDVKLSFAAEVIWHRKICKETEGSLNTQVDLC